ncbi:DUF4145 domain-containing protein [Priestia sp. 179-F W1.4 NHS]|uniref:DUF4145 domain-containing protein n=1 Tax=Priestia sp. 179-F W1.4 NHS TaxID=3374296 RepID=UPI0038792163
MKQNYEPPNYGKNSFHCPHCNTFSHQSWHGLRTTQNESFVAEQGIAPTPKGMEDAGVNGYLINNVIALSKCYKCRQVSVWKKGKLIFPVSSMAPIPNPDMPDDVKRIYEEAMEVVSISPMASTALLRLALEKLLPQIGAEKANIDNMIGQLVKKGLPQEVQRALDSLRVIGNEAVHPGTIDLNDNTDIAFALFKLLNFVVDRMITQLKEIDEIYNLIPTSKIKSIENRNEKVLKK